LRERNKKEQKKISAGKMGTSPNLNRRGMKRGGEWGKKSCILSAAREGQEAAGRQSSQKKKKQKKKTLQQKPKHGRHWK